MSSSKDARSWYHRLCRRTFSNNCTVVTRGSKRHEDSHVAVLKYFDNNWHGIREQWVEGLILQQRSFMTRKNKHVESVNQKLRSFITMFSNIGTFFNELKVSHWHLQQFELLYVYGQLRCKRAYVHFYPKMSLMCQGIASDHCVLG